MPRTVNLELASERRHQILLAASNVFRARGFHGARMEEICQTAGISPGSVYRHFEGKEAIIAAIVETQTKHYFETVDRFMGSTEALKDLFALDEASLRQLIAPHEYDVGDEIWLEILRNPKLAPLVAKADAKVRKRVVSALKRAQQAGAMDKSLDARAVGDVLLALFSGIAFDAGIDPDYDLAASAGTHKILFRRFLQPKK